MMPDYMLNGYFLSPYCSPNLYSWCRGACEVSTSLNYFKAGKHMIQHEAKQYLLYRVRVVVEAPVTKQQLFQSHAVTLVVCRDT